MINNFEELNVCINKIVWWIPFKKLRNSVRNVLHYVCSNIENINNNIQYVNNNIEYVKILEMRLSYKESILHSCTLSNINFLFYDSITSNTFYIVKEEIENEYNFDSIKFEEGDIVIDIGANIGMVSIYLAKKYPFIKIYSFEPVRNNYKNLVENIKINNINNITAINAAISNNIKKIDMDVNITNSGGSGIYNHNINSNLLFDIDVGVDCISFDDIFNNFNIQKCRLLKIDCEGSEFEILYNANTEKLKLCENMRAEFHRGHEINKKLYDYCKQYIKNIEYKSI